MTTIVLVRKNNEVVVAGDGQVSMGNTVVKSTASKVRKIEKRDVVAGFAGSTADALTLFERLEAKIEKHAGNLSRAAVELAKDWRTDKYLRRLEALMAIGDKENSYIISGTGDVLEPEGDIGRLYSGRGEVALKVEVTDKVKEGIVFTTFHFPEHMVNMVTGHGKDEETMCAEYKVSSVQVQKISNQFKTEINPTEKQAEVLSK